MPWPNLENRFTTFFAIALEHHDDELASRLAFIVHELRRIDPLVGTGLRILLEYLDQAERTPPEDVHLDALRDLASDMLDLLTRAAPDDSCGEPVAFYDLSEPLVEVVRERGERAAERDENLADLEQVELPVAVLIFAYIRLRSAETASELRLRESGVDSQLAQSRIQAATLCRRDAMAHEINVAEPMGLSRNRIRYSEAGPMKDGARFSLIAATPS